MEPLLLSIARWCTFSSYTLYHKSLIFKQMTMKDEVHNRMTFGTTWLIGEKKLSYVVAIIQRITSCHKNNMTTCYTKNGYVKCPKNLNTKVSDKMTYANSADPDQTAPGGAV